MPHGQVVVADQGAARELVERAIDAELWRTDRRRTARAILCTLVDAMDWRTGLITGATREKAAVRAGASVRTVSRVIAWATRTGLLACVERGATAAFLGTRTHRAPAYVVTHPAGMPVPRPRRVADEPPAGAKDAQPVDQNGNPPASCVSTQTLVREGVKRASPKCPAWPGRDRAGTGPQRAAATATVLDRAGITHRVPAWKARAMLAAWWRAGWCVSGLLYAIDHHPDRPDQGRGDAVRGARDPLAVIGHRLAAWRGRSADLPTSLASVDPQERRRRAHQLAQATETVQPSGSVATPEARAQARALFAQHRRRAVA